MRGQVSKETNAIHRFPHTSLFTLLGICVEEVPDQDLYLVFEYIENGSFSNYIHSARSHAGCPNLSWNQRLQIALDIAEGLEYLHQLSLAFTRTLIATIFFWTRIFEQRSPISDWPNAKQMWVLVCRSGSKLKEEGERLLGKVLFFPSPSFLFRANPVLPSFSFRANPVLVNNTIR